MRIALVSQEYPPQTAKGGIGSQTHAKAHGLAALGHDVFVVSRSTTGSPEHHADGGVRVLRIVGLEHIVSAETEPVQWITYSTAVAGELARLHAEVSLDLVDFPDWGCEAYIHLLNRTGRRNIPTVIHLHGPLVMFGQAIGWPAQHSEFYRTGTAMEATCLRLADAVFSSSECSAEWCATHYGLVRAQTPIIHTGVDTDRFAPSPLQKAERPTIVFVGSIVRNKGVEVLVHAACEVARVHPGLQLHLIGRGETSLLEELRATARTAGLPALLSFAGYVDHADLPAELSRAHVFAAPSVYEGGPGFVYLEAMACGLPVIGCSGSGASEVIRDGETGLLVPPEDVDALAAALLRLLGDRTERDAMGRRARAYVVREASRAACLPRIEAFYSNVIAAFANNGATGEDV